METNQALAGKDFIPATISDNAQVVLEKRYFLRNDQGDTVEDADGMFRRVANAIADGDRLYGKSDAEVAATAEDVLPFYG